VYPIYIKSKKSTFSSAKPIQRTGYPPTIAVGVISELDFNSIDRDLQHHTSTMIGLILNRK
ncbi:MAG: hypothetical protein ABIJ97_12700, partial [Bacteroidota bacterium]